MAVQYDRYFTSPPWGDFDALNLNVATGRPRNGRPEKPPSRTRPGWPADWQPKRTDYALLRQPRPPEEPKVPWWLVACIYAVPIVVVVVLVVVVEVLR